MLRPRAQIGVLWLLGAWIARAVRAQRRRRLASGAKRRLSAIARTGQVGTILPRETEAVPGLGEGVAFAAEYDLRGRRMLHDAASLGFDVLLDTGERVVIPAGTCLIALDEAPGVHADTTAHLASLDPVRLPTFDPFVHARVRAVVLRPGDRVEVCNPLDAIPDPVAGYRDAGQLRAPRGDIRLRPC